MRTAAIDYGRKRIGLALSDELGYFAHPHLCLEAMPSLEKTADLVASELKKYLPLKALIIGLPLLMSGKEGEMSQEVREFATLLETRLGLSVQFYDERLTSLQVEKLMQEADLSRKQRAKRMDQMAAMVLLQTYLDSI